MPQDPSLSQAELLNRFSYHAPAPGQPERYQAIRTAQLEFAILLRDSVPGSRELSLALTKLEEVGFWANAGIARRDP